MASLDDPGVARLLADRNHAVLSTLNSDGSIHSTVVWVDTIDGQVAVNSAVGRTWPTNLGNNPTVNVTVYDESNPYDYVEIRGTAMPTLDGAEEHIDRLAKKYMDADSYPFRTPEEKRITFVIDAAKVRHQKQG